ncbi:uncharacterized protein [Antedon mediterranea]|uniref:uncharacterized protein n=1 Tax=Antedon mediterranea TaxID=105859 RepID=UPI003AF4CD75
MSGRGYIMLCYSWKDERIVEKIWERLEQAGYRVWIDRSGTDGLKRKHKSIYIEMAKAVKNATVVIGCLSKAYQESENCLREGNMIGNRNKDCFPIIAEKGYKRNEWVETIFGGQIYIDFSNAEDFENSFKILLLRLKDYTDLNPNTNDKDSSDNTSQHAATSGENPGKTTQVSDVINILNSEIKELQKHVADLKEQASMVKDQYKTNEAVGSTIPKVLRKANLNEIADKVENATNKLMDLAKKLGTEWKQVGVYLGFKQEDFYRFENDSGNNTAWAIFSMLDRWYKNAEIHERYEKLTKALKESDRKDLADEVQSWLA